MARGFVNKRIDCNFKEGSKEWIPPTQEAAHICLRMKAPKSRLPTRTNQHAPPAGVAAFLKPIRVFYLMGSDSLNSISRIDNTVGDAHTSHIK